MAAVHSCKTSQACDTHRHGSLVQGLDAISERARHVRVQQQRRDQQRGRQSCKDMQHLRARKRIFGCVRKRLGHTADQPGLGMGRAASTPARGQGGIAGGQRRLRRAGSHPLS